MDRPRVVWDGNPPVARCSIHRDSFEPTCNTCTDAMEEMRALARRLIDRMGAPKEKG